MNNSKLHNLFGIIIAAMCIIAMPLDSQAATKAKNITAQKERLVLMPLRVPQEDKNLTGAMEAALVEALQQKYDVFSGEQVSQKARQIFLKESRNKAHKECDETRCMQNIAEAFQAELIAIANVTKQDGSYFLALSIQNIFDNKVVYSKSVTCENCKAVQVIEKLKELNNESSGSVDTIAVKPSAKRVYISEPDLWDIAQRGNSIKYYRAYLDQYPTGQFASTAKYRISLLRLQFNPESIQEEQDLWRKAINAATEASYLEYMRLYPQGIYFTQAQARINKLRETTNGTQAKSVAEPKVNYVSQGGLTWMPVTFDKNWSDANAYCTNTAINGQTGWRLPTKDELSDLYLYQQYQGWTLRGTWTSTPEGSDGHFIVNPNSGIVVAGIDTSNYFVTCVRK